MAGWMRGMVWAGCLAWAGCGPWGGWAAEGGGVRGRAIPGRVLDYAPADGEVCGVNPPAFRWIPAGGGDTRYVLEVARDRDFKDLAYRAENLRWRIEAPDKPLPPGAYWWRFGVTGEGGGVAEWGDTRAFRVADDAEAFPFPEPGWAGRLSRLRPRLVFEAASLPEFRRRAGRGGDLEATVARVAGEVRPRVGQTLIGEPARLPEDRQERLKAYVDIFRATRPPMDDMERLALMYLLTGERALGEEAKRRVLHFLSWDPHGSTSVFHNDEPAMWILFRAPLAYDWTWDLFSPEEREAVEAALLARGRELFQLLVKRPFDSNPFESHAGRITAILGTAAVLLAPDHAEAREWLDYLLRLYYGAYPCWGGDAGGWNEGTAYWNSYVSFMLNFAVALKFAGGPDLLRKPFFRNTPYYMYYSQPPFVVRRTFGDGGYSSAARANGELLRQFSVLYRDPYLKYYADQTGAAAGRAAYAMALRLTGDDGLTGRAPAQLPTSRCFGDVGLVALRNTLTDGGRHVGMLFHSNPFGNVSHGHNDQNAFSIEAFGEPLAVATGYYDYYGSEHHDGWTRQTKAKNAITFDGGQGQDRGWHAVGRITRFDDNADVTLTAGDATAAYGGRLTRAIREIVFLKAAGVFVIRDDLAAPMPRSFEFRLHALDEMTVDEPARTVVLRRPKARLTAQFLHPAALRFSQTDRFDVEVAPARKTADMVDNWHLTAAGEPAKETQFLTVLSTFPAGSAPPAVVPGENDAAIGVEIRTADGRSWLAGFARPGIEGEFELGGVLSDERFFAREKPRD